jgi:hypothetical protein
MHKYLIFIYSLCFCILSACGRSTIVTPSEISIQTDSKKVVANGTTSIAVPGLYNPVVPGFYFNISYDNTENISELAAIELRRLLFHSKKYKIYSSHETSRHDYTVNIKCTEFVPDTTSLKGERKIPTTQAASIITMVGANMATAAPFLGPIGGLIAGFEPLTGIGLGSEQREMNSMLTLDVQLIDRSGAILYSKPYSAGFTTKVLERGSIVSSSSKAVASSSAHEAVLAALDLAFKDIQANTK